MDTSPRVLIWNYTYEEMLGVDAFFQAVGAPEVQVIEPAQGALTVGEILSGKKGTGGECPCPDKIMLFNQVDPQTIQRVMRESGDWELPRPIYAVVTSQSIQWTFSELAEHLVRERDFIHNKRAERQKGKSPRPHSED